QTSSCSGLVLERLDVIAASACMCGAVRKRFRTIRWNTGVPTERWTAKRQPHPRRNPPRIACVRCSMHCVSPPWPPLPLGGRPSSSIGTHERRSDTADSSYAAVSGTLHGRRRRRHHLFAPTDWVPDG